MLMIPTPNGLGRLKKLGAIQILKDKSTNCGVRVRILSPLRGTHHRGENNVLHELASLGKRRSSECHEFVSVIV
jgi:hypothetical protein